MKKMKKPFMYGLSMISVMAISVAGTLAYLTDQKAVTNTFTMGNVKIELDEASVTLDGEPIAGADRVTGNQYHLIPGQKYIKDPTMRVLKDSEEAYVRMLLTLNNKTELDEVFAPGIKLDEIFDGWDSETWRYIKETNDATADTVTYEFRYKETVVPEDENVVLDALFDSFEIPSYLTGDDLQKLQEDGEFKITVEGHAIQAKGFTDDNEAWDAFDAQAANK